MYGPIPKVPLILKRWLKKGVTEMRVWVWLDKRVKVHQMPLIITSCNTHKKKIFYVNFVC